MHRYFQDDCRHLRRFDVLPTGDGSYSVEGLGTFGSIAEAFTAVLERGGRVHLSWSRTVIGGQTVPHDFTARFEGEDAGRILKTVGAGSWTAASGGFNPATNRLGTSIGLHEEKDAAVAWIEHQYTRLMARGGEE